MFTWGRWRWGRVGHQTIQRGRHSVVAERYNYSSCEIDPKILHVPSFLTYRKLINQEVSLLEEVRVRCDQSLVAGSRWMGYKLRVYWGLWILIPSASDRNVTIIITKPEFSHWQSAHPFSSGSCLGLVEVIEEEEVTWGFHSTTREWRRLLVYCTFCRRDTMICPWPCRRKVVIILIKLWTEMNSVFVDLLGFINPFEEWRLYDL